MERFDAQPDRTLVTSSGVTVVVRAPPPPPEPTPLPEPPRPRVVVRPPGPTGVDRDAVAREIVTQHGDLIRRTLARRRDVAAESARDIQQRVLMIVCAQMESGAPPDNLSGFIRGVVRNEIANHKRTFRPEVDRGADPEAEPCAAPDPEASTGDAELRAKLAGYLRILPRAQAEVVCCVDLQGMTIDEAAAALGRKRGTVSTQLTRAREKLQDLARESERRTRGASG